MNLNIIIRKYEHKQNKNLCKKSPHNLLKGVQQRLAYWGIDKKGKVTEEVKPIEGGYIFVGMFLMILLFLKNGKNLNLLLQDTQ